MIGGNQAVMPAHLSSSQSLQMQHSAHQQQQQQKSQSSSNNRNSADQTSFSAVLRNLAKQQDIKDDDMSGQPQQQQPQQQPSDGKSRERMSEKEIDMSRQGNSSRSLPYDARGHTTIRHMSSPEPPEKKVKDFILNLLLFISYFFRFRD